MSEFLKSMADGKWWLTIIIAAIGAIYSYSNSEAMRKSQDDQQDSRIISLEETSKWLQRDVRYLVMRECLKDPNRDINPNCNGVK